MEKDLLSKKIYGLDFLRSAAIILVFLWHYRRYGVPEWLSGLADFGWSGVDLFFVLSGYLIGVQLLQKVADDHPVSITAFYTRRFFRIIPAYLVVLVLYFSIPGFQERDGLAPLWKFLTFMMNFHLDYQHAGSFSHAWSLCIEEQFYLVFPLFVLLFSGPVLRKYAIYLVLILFLAGFATRFYSWQMFVAPQNNDPDNLSAIANSYSMYVYYPTYNRLDGLLTGVSIAMLFTFRPAIKEKMRTRSNLLFAIGLIILFGTFLLSGDFFSLSTATFSYPLVSIGYGFLVMAAIFPNCLINRLDLKIFSQLATISYSVYLTHKQLNHLTQDFLTHFDLNDNIKLLICFAVSLAGGTLLYLLVERPFLLLRDKLLNTASHQKNQAGLSR